MNPGILRLNRIVVVSIAIAVLASPAAVVGDPSVDGASPVNFTWAPTSPGIGAFVGFNITGVPVAEIERAEWTFGGIGCDGTESYSCIEPHFPSCDQAAFAYASGGSKTVRLTVTTTGGVVQPQVSRTLTVQSVGSCSGSCSYWISPTTRDFSSGGGNGSIAVSTESGCTWTADENTTWISITSGSSGSGSGTVNYHVNPNLGPGRSASITVADRTHTVTQGSGNGCSYGIEPTAIFLPGIGGIESVDITTDAGCGWTITAPDSWITVISPASGIGPGAVTYAVDANPAGPRSGVVLIADQIHTVDQADLGPCEVGDVHDDGTVENGYGWGDGSIFVQRFTPVGYPFVYTDVCAAFTQAAGDPTLGFDVVIFDDDGPAGTPGSLLGVVPAIVGGVPAWLDHTFASVAIENVGVTIDEGAVYVGVRWDESAELGFFVAADESPATPTQTGYYSQAGASWIPLSNGFPGYRSLMVRADGFATSDGEWEQVVGSIFGGGNGFGDPSNVDALTMASFGGALYVGTQNQYGGEVDFSEDGRNWFLGNNPGFGDPTNDAVANLISFDGQLYASTVNPVFGTQVWRMAAPASWTNVAGDGFGDSSNESAPSGVVFNGNLFLGTRNTGGCEIWRSPDGIEWTQAHTNGFGNPQNQSTESMAAFRGGLWVGTKNIGGAELWRSPDGSIWLSAMIGGFGSASNEAITELVVFDDAVYAGVSNAATGAQLWRSFNGISWAQVIGDGFGDPNNSEFGALTVGGPGLVAAVSGPSTPGTIWQSPDGSIWTPSSSPGFTEPNNHAIRALGRFGDRVYAGTWNPADGCEVWRGGRYPLFEDGFESGDTGAWGAVVP